MLSNRVLAVNDSWSVKMRFEDLNWMDVDKYLAQDDRVILITGATEQHAYLSLLTDILIPSRIALAVSERTGVLIAPPLNFGVSYYFVDFPGTISLSEHTFDAVLSEIVEGLLQQGFARFFIMNGHGGNKIPSRLTDLNLEGIAHITWYNWWRGDAVHAFEDKHGLQLNHANWGENFPFNRVAESPAEIKLDVDMEMHTDANASARDTLGDGSFGGQYQVSDEMMQELFGSVVEEAVSLLVGMPAVD